VHVRRVRPDGERPGPRSSPGWPLKWSRYASRPPLTRGLHRFFQGATWLRAGIFLLLTARLAVLMLTEPAGCVPDALNRRHHRARHRRNRRFCTVIPLGAAHA
jgi:hypothetical protein